jgi:hypothetical protein
MIKPASHWCNAVLCLPKVELCSAALAVGKPEQQLTLVNPGSNFGQSLCLPAAALLPAGAMGSLRLMIPNEYDLKQVSVLLWSSPNVLQLLLFKMNHWPTRLATLRHHVITIMTPINRTVLPAGAHTAPQ